MNATDDWQYERVYLPRGLDRKAAMRVLVDKASHGRWELDRVRLYPDGSRRVVLRRRIIRQRSTLTPVLSGPPSAG